MAAKTSSQVFTVTPIAGVALGSKTSALTSAIKPLTNVLGSDGYRYFAVKASEALGSIETVKIGASGSASTDAGTAGFTMNAPGGLTAGQYGFARKTAL